MAFKDNNYNKNSGYLVTWITLCSTHLERKLEVNNYYPRNCYIIEICVKCYGYNYAGTWLWNIGKNVEMGNA